MTISFITQLLSDDINCCNKLYCKPYFHNATTNNSKANTVELQWLERLQDHIDMIETGVVRASEC